MTYCNQSVAELNPKQMSDLDLFTAVIGRTGNTPCRVQEGDLPISEWLDAATSSDPVVLKNTLGLTEAEAHRLAVVLQFHQRLLVRRHRDCCLSPEVVAQLMMPHLIQDCESLWGIFLDSHNGMIGDIVEVTRGDIDSCDASPRAFFRNALKRGASKAIAVHNHPTGDPTPSSADIAVTEGLLKAGRIVDVNLVDHVVCTKTGDFVSIKRARPEIFRPW